MLEPNIFQNLKYAFFTYSGAFVDEPDINISLDDSTSSICFCT